MLILYSLIILLSSASFSKSYFNPPFNSSLTEWCVCKNRDYRFSNCILSCSHDDPEDSVVIDISHTGYSERRLIIDCKNVSSFKLIPDLTYYYKYSNVDYTNCMVPRNESINQLISKISKNHKNLVIKFHGNERKFNLNINYFKGLESLETLEIDLNETITTNITANVFEHLYNLKNLTLHNTPLPYGIFRTLSNLQSLTIYLNIYTDIEGSDLKNQANHFINNTSCLFEYCSFNSLIFENLINLERLEIEGVQTFGDWKSFDEDYFNNSTNLQEMKLNTNNFKSLPKNIFQHQTKLKCLCLTRIQLTELLDGTFHNTKDLTYLNLSHNRLESISSFIFRNLRRLTHLILNNNAIKTIESHSFLDLENLISLHLQHNQVSKFNMFFLIDSLYQIVEIDFSYNNLTEFQLYDAPFFNLTRLNLSHNNISNLRYALEDILSNIQKCEIDLSYNKLTKTEFNIEHLYSIIKNINQEKRTRSLVNLGMRISIIQKIQKIQLNFDENPIICDCKAKEFIQFIKRDTKPIEIYSFIEIDSLNLRCKAPNNLHGRHLRNLGINELFCDIEKDCPKECKCQNSTDNTIIFNCSTSNLQELPTFPKFAGENSSKIQLYAANNQIHSIQLHAIPDDLTILDLRNNSLQTLPYNVMIRFESIDQLYLSLNPWICDCNSVELVYFFHYYRSKIVDADAMMCSDHRSFKLLESKDLCVQLSHVYFLLLMGTLLLALCSTILVIFKKEIKIWLYAHNCCLGCISEEEADKDMIYDAFFVFSHHDNNFVTDMIIDLEEKGFKCCVHHRDWAAGEMIVTLALESIKTSRRIIVVLSPMFIQSNWATWEFRVALIHAFNQKRSRVLVIIYGDVSLIDDLDDDLKTYIAYNTYLDSEDMWFDEKLLYAMPHKTVPVVQKRKLTSSTVRSEDDDISNFSIQHQHIDIESDTMSHESV